MANLNITWSGATAEAGIKGYRVEWKKSTDVTFPSQNYQDITTTNQNGQALVENVAISTIYNVRVKTIDNNNIESIYITKDINVESAFMLQRSVMSSTNSLGVCNFVDLTNLYSSVPIAILGVNDHLYTTSNLDEKFNQNSSTRYWKLAHPDLQSNGRPHQIDSNGKIVSIGICEVLSDIYTEYRISVPQRNDPTCTSTLATNTQVYLKESDLDSINSLSKLYIKIGTNYQEFFGGSGSVVVTGAYYIIKPYLVDSTSPTSKLVIKLQPGSKCIIDYVQHVC